MGLNLDAAIQEIVTTFTQIKTELGKPGGKARAALILASKGPKLKKLVGDVALEMGIDPNQSPREILAALKAGLEKNGSDAAKQLKEVLPEVEQYYKGLEEKVGPAKDAAKDAAQKAIRKFRGLFGKPGNE